MRARSSSRLMGNLISLVITISALFLTANIADSDFTRRISEISRSLDRALDEMLQIEHSNYTEYVDDSVYMSKPEYNPLGMGGLYNLTGKFMDLLVSKAVYPEGVVEIIDGEVDFNPEELPSVALQYAGLLTIIVLMLLFAVFMPLCGFCFCCCRCCGKCGARSRPIDKKHDLCRKIILATILICLGTLMLFGVVCVFVSNQRVQDGTEEWSDNMRVSVADTKQYLKSIDGQIDNLFRVNYKEFEDTTFRILERTSEIVFEQLAEYSNATAMTAMFDMVQGLDDVKANLTRLKESTNGLRVNASQLNDALRKVKRDLLQTLSKCQTSVSQCANLSNIYINNLGSDIDFNRLPDISNELESLDNILKQNITQAVKQGVDSLNEIRNRIDTEVKSQLEKVTVSVRNAGHEIQNGSGSVSNVIKDASNTMQEYSDKYLDEADVYIIKYSPYRYYGSLAVCCILLLVTLCIVLGLICGICGKRPDAYGDDCCNKGSGSRFLMCGVMVMFLSGIVMVAAVLVYFISGVLFQRVICDTMRDSSYDNQVLNAVDQLVNPKRDQVNISHVLLTCHKNESIYNVLKLDSVYNVSEVAKYLDKFDIEKALDNLKDQIEQNVDTSVNILSDTAAEQLRNLSHSGIANISYYKFTDVLENNFTTANLSIISSELENLIRTIQNNNIPNMEETISDLQLSILHLQTYQAKLVEPMVASAEEMISIAKSLEIGLKFNKSSFAEAIEDLISEVKEAEDFLKTNGTEGLKKSASDFAVAVVDHIQTFLDRIVNKTSKEIGKCGPMSLVVNATLVATCDKIVRPWNGFWFGVFWSLILFVPTIIVSVKLATLYQKYNPYGGHLIETEYLYDAYTDHDNIPLNSRNKPKKKQKVIRRDERSAVPTAAGDADASRQFPGSSQDARYADMAPKHWEEFPASGPPQYQRAPTEYERPPPYYYPASGDNPQQ